MSIEVPHDFPSRLARSSVLVVDDHHSDLRLMQAMLDHLGFDVTASSNVGAALLANAERRFDLIFLDYRLDSDSGADVCRTMRSQHARRGASKLSDRRLRGVRDAG